MTKRELLIDKMEKEFQVFISETMEKSPEEIVNSAFEKVMKEDILFGLQGYELPKKKVDYLLTREYPLDELFQNWLKSDRSYMEELMGFVEGYVTDRLAKEKQKER